MKMDENGKVQAKISVNKLTPCGMTNIWDSLKLGLDISRNEKLFNT